MLKIIVSCDVSDLPASFRGVFTSWLVSISYYYDDNTRTPHGSKTETQFDAARVVIVPQDACVALPTESNRPEVCGRLVLV